MRVPIPLVLFLCLAVIVGFWWHGTRNTDFLTPPNEAELAQIREKIRSTSSQVSLPPSPVTPATMEKTPTAPVPAAPPPKPAAELGDLNSPPSLGEYTRLASQGAPALIDAALTLENLGHLQRALLAWERTIDTAKPDTAQRERAIAAIQRLRPSLPDWNTEPDNAIEIVLHAGTGKKTAETLGPAIEETARELTQISSGILKVSANVISGRDHQAAPGPAPVALWITGSAEDSPSTDVLSFTVKPESNSHHELRKTVFLLIRGYLARTATHNTPVGLSDQTSPLEALNHHITRISWHALGTLLNQAPKPHE